MISRWCGRVRGICAATLITLSLQACSLPELPDSEDDLIKLAEDPDPAVGGRSAQKIASTYGEAGVLRLFEQSDSQGKAFAAALLMGYPSPDNRRRLLAALGADDSRVRAAAASSLRVMCDRQCIPELERLLNDPDEQVRFVAQDTLRATRDK